jgi:hypothetical protein
MLLLGFASIGFTALSLEVKARRGRRAVPLDFSFHLAERIQDSRQTKHVAGIGFVLPIRFLL